MLCFRMPNLGRIENICVAANGATHFSCVASAAHFLFLEVVFYDDRNNETQKNNI